MITKISSVLIFLVPFWLLSQSTTFQTTDTLDEIVFDGNHYQENHYFIIWNGTDPFDYSSYKTYIYRFNNDLVLIDTIQFGSYGDWTIYPLKILIENDTIFSFGTAINKITDDNQINISKLTTDFNWINHSLIGTDTLKESLTDAIFSNDGKLIIAGISFTNFYDQSPLAIKCNKNCQVEAFTVDTSSTSVKPTVVELYALGIFHFADMHQINVYDSDLNVINTIVPEYYDRFWFTYHLENYSGNAYFTGGNIPNIVENKKNPMLGNGIDGYREIAYYLVEDQSEVLDSGFINLPNYNDYNGGIYYTSTGSFILGGVNNYNPGSPPFFEEELRYIIVQNMDFSTKEENWLFEYGGDANYFMEGLYLNEENSECIVYANRYDWMNTDKYERDVLLIKIDSTGRIVGNQSENVMDNRVRVFPNPSRGKITVECSMGNSELLLYDIYGRVVLKKLLLASRNTFESDHLRNGTYIYKVLNLKSSEIITGIWLKN